MAIKEQNKIQLIYLGNKFYQVLLDIKIQAYVINL